MKKLVTLRKPVGVKPGNVPSSRRANCLRRRIEMDSEPTITLYCVRKDGRREGTKISDHTMADARELADWLLYTGNGLYTEVDICTEDGTVKTIRSSAVPSPGGTA